jgi:hypothetical protein
MSNNFERKKQTQRAHKKAIPEYQSLKKAEADRQKAKSVKEAAQFMLDDIQMI